MKTMDRISRILAMVIGLQLLLILVFWVGLNGELDQPGSLIELDGNQITTCLLYTSPSPRDLSTSRMPSSA